MRYNTRLVNYKQMLICTEVAELVKVAEKKGFKQYGTVREGEIWVQKGNGESKIRLTYLFGKCGADLRHKGNSSVSMTSADIKKVIAFLNEDWRYE